MDLSLAWLLRAAVSARSCPRCSECREPAGRIPPSRRWRHERLDWSWQGKKVVISRRGSGERGDRPATWILKPTTAAWPITNTVGLGQMVHVHGGTKLRAEMVALLEDKNARHRERRCLRAAWAVRNGQAMSLGLMLLSADRCWYYIFFNMNAEMWIITSLTETFLVRHLTWTVSPLICKRGTRGSGRSLSQGAKKGR